MLSAQTGFTQETFNTCTGQTVLYISGPTTSTVQNLTGSPANIQITARGGDGGGSFIFGSGGSGATMIGDFVLADNATLRAISGAKGNDEYNGDGGGGSGAVDCGNPNNCATGIFLIIAAGGSGTGEFGLGLGGSASTTGSGNGGSGIGSEGGGGGIYGNGSGNGGGQVLKTGLSEFGTLGMGGGGRADNNGEMFGGGGGGHTGGGGFFKPASSFNSGTSQNNTDGGNGGGTNEGSVDVVCLSLVLPVELVDFKAAVSQGKVDLYWQTASELHNLGYQVQRSPDARNWKDLGFVAGAGTTQQEQRYAFTDATPLPGINYYRLRQTDFDGRSEYSPILVANLGFASKALTFFPNPAPEGLTSLYFPEAPEGEGLLEVFDWLGNKVHRQTILLEGGSDVLVPLDLHIFPAGMYVATLEMGGQVFSEKLMLKQ